MQPLICQRTPPCYVRNVKGKLQSEFNEQAGFNVPQPWFLTSLYFYNS